MSHVPKIKKNLGTINHGLTTKRVIFQAIRQKVNFFTKNFLIFSKSLG